MKRNALLIISLILCGIPGCLACLGGSLVAGLGFLSDAAQLKLDTNLERSALIGGGLAGMAVGALLIAVPLLVWWFRSRRKAA